MGQCSCKSALAFLRHLPKPPFPATAYAQTFAARKKCNNYHLSPLQPRYDYPKPLPFINPAAHCS